MIIVPLLLFFLLFGAAFAAWEGASVNELCNFEPLQRNTSDVFDRSMRFDQSPPLVVPLPQLAKTAADRANTYIVAPFTGFRSVAEQTARTPVTRGVVILDEYCKVVEHLPDDSAVNVYSALTAADVDGFPDSVEIIFVGLVAGKRVLYVMAYDASAARHMVLWTAELEAAAGAPYHPLVFDVDSDGHTEIVIGNDVFDGASGVLLSGTRAVSSGLPGDAAASSRPREAENLQVRAYADYDNDGRLDLVACDAVWSLNMGNTFADANSTRPLRRVSWERTAPLVQPDRGNFSLQYSVFADVGSMHDGEFDGSRADGIMEIIATFLNADLPMDEPSAWNGYVALYVQGSERGQRVFTEVFAHSNIVSNEWRRANNFSKPVFGPPVVADIDGDGALEFGTSDVVGFTMFDLKCKSATQTGCRAANVRWVRRTKASESGLTGASIFTFAELNGRPLVSVVHADECFLRIMDAETGRVLYSHVSGSPTRIELPVVANLGRAADEPAELVFVRPGLDADLCPAHDVYFDGRPCKDNDDCPGSAECNLDRVCQCDVEKSYACPSDQVCVAAPRGDYTVCSPWFYTTHAITVLSSDKWMRARPIFNSYTYRPANVRDDLSVPTLRQATAQGINASMMRAAGPYSFPTCAKPCLNGGVCVGDGRCECTLGFVGDACDMVVVHTPKKDTDTAVSATTLTSAVQVTEAPNANDATIAIGIGVGVGLCTLLVLVAAYCIVRRKRAWERRSGGKRSHHGVSRRRGANAGSRRSGNSGLELPSARSKHNSRSNLHAAPGGNLYSPAPRGQKDGYTGLREKETPQTYANAPAPPPPPPRSGGIYAPANAVGTVWGAQAQAADWGGAHAQADYTMYERAPVPQQRPGQFGSANGSWYDRTPPVTYHGQGGGTLNGGAGEVYANGELLAMKSPVSSGTMTHYQW